MKRIAALVFLMIYGLGIIGIFSGCSTGGHSGTIDTWEELYEVVAEDCVDFVKTGTYTTSFDPKSFSYSKLVEAGKLKDDVAIGSLYHVLWHIDKKATTYTIKLTFKYYINKWQYNQVCRMSEDIADSMIAFTDYEKVKATHDYLIDYNNYHVGSDGPYRALYKGTTNCNGYALSFMSIMRECGIPCTYETGDNHAWNRVKLDGEWYNIDVTWDDTGVWDKEGGITYDYFLKSDGDWMKHHHGGATAAKSYAADLSLTKEIPNYDKIYTIRTIVIIVVLIVVVIAVISFVKRAKNASY